MLDAIEADISYPFQKARGSVVQVTELLHLEAPPRQRLPPLVSRCKTEGRTRKRVVARAFVTPVPEPSANDRCLLD
jgi:hypothetical protein